MFEILRKIKLQRTVPKVKHKHDCCNINPQTGKQNKDLNAHKY